MEDEEEDHLIFEKVAGVALAAILTIAGVMAAGWGDISVEPRMETFAQEIPGMIFWWREDVGPLVVIGIALVLAPIVLVPGAFGVRFRRILPTLRPRSRAFLVLGLAAAIGAEAVAYRTLGGRDIGVATIDGVQARPMIGGAGSGRPRSPAGAGQPAAIHGPNPATAWSISLAFRASGRLGCRSGWRTRRTGP